MLIIGVDYHPSSQQIASLNQETGVAGELLFLQPVPRQNVIAGEEP
jgi:hypothetical protein